MVYCVHDINIDKCIIKRGKMYILVLFRFFFFFFYHDTMNAFVTQLGIYMSDYRVWYLVVTMTAYGRSSSVGVQALLVLTRSIWLMQKKTKNCLNYI